MDVRKDPKSSQQYKYDCAQECVGLAKISEQKLMRRNYQLFRADK